MPPKPSRGPFWVRSVNTLVVNLASQPPSLMLVVGKYTPPAPGSETAPHSWTPAPTGIVAFGGGLCGRFRDFSTDQCGTAACEPDDDGFDGFHAGGAFWVTPFLAAEAASSNCLHQRRSAGAPGSGSTARSMRASSASPVS